jgi:hypothetical protein
MPLLCLDVGVQGGRGSCRVKDALETGNATGHGGDAACLLLIPYLTRNISTAELLTTQTAAPSSSRLKIQEIVYSYLWTERRGKFRDASK